MSDAALKNFFDHQTGLGLSPESLFGLAPYFINFMVIIINT
jgi:hypothetical protein